MTLATWVEERRKVPTQKLLPVITVGARKNVLLVLALVYVIEAIERKGVGIGIGLNKFRMLVFGY